ncbi:MAG: MotA/TolQ/ExbB proton channel family protein [Planctomycetes bacterium]|nr:MotA/TolQ/ExbB proton channel family protein [Planctomycetota bacterium]
MARGQGPSNAEAPAPIEKTEPAKSAKGESVAASTQRSLISFFRDGGPLMYPILGCSVIMVLFSFERMISLRRRKIIHKPFVKQFLHQIREGKFDREDALDFCESNHSVIAGVFAAAVRKWGRPAVEVEQAILDAGERAANGMRRNLRLLNGVATISPLLGLLGTVFGMIMSFNEIAHADAMGSPEQLAGGIGMALLTTAFGLTVAIPSMISYMYFLSRVDRLVMEIDALGQELISEISAEELTDKEEKPRGKKKAA